MNNKPEPFDEMDQAAKGPVEEPSKAEPTKAEPTPSPFGGTDQPDAWKAKAAEYLAGWKRAQADYQNLRRSVEQEKVGMVKYANEALLQDLLPLVDHFNMAFKAVPEKDRTSSWLKGVEHISTNLKQVLQEYGVTVMNTVGQKFDPTQHESVGEMPSEQPEGTVAEEMSAGFLLHGKVVQPAKVKISTGKSK
ncbi:MAG: nucleotide exchange factor GrpE [Patescibacteria group bacterium]